MMSDPEAAAPRPVRRLRLVPPGDQATASPGTPVAPAQDPTSVDHTLSVLLRLELEDVLQSIYAARQDLLGATSDPSGEDARRSAESTLHGAAATVQLLLRFLRTVADDELREDPLMRVMSGPFGVLRLSRDVLYFNTAMRELIGIDHRSLALRRFEERLWIDRDVMADHLARATDDGHARIATTLTREDGDALPVVVRTVRIDDPSEPLLLVGVTPRRDRTGELGTRSGHRPPPGG